MKAQLKLACLTLASMCLVPWMRYMTLSDKDSIENNSSVENQPSSVEDLEPSTITELLIEMRKGSMQREFLIEKHAEKSWQVASLAHFLWIGSVIPAKYVNNINNFCQHNLEYQVILWTDLGETGAEQLYHTVEQRDANSLLGGAQNEAVFRQITEVGARADLLKYEVVFQFGGIYLDTDTISVQPLRGRLSESFVAFRLAPYYNIQSSIFGFPKGSYFLQFVLETAKLHFASEDFGKLSVPEQFGPTFFTTMFVRSQVFLKV